MLDTDWGSYMNKMKFYPHYLLLKQHGIKIQGLEISQIPNLSSIPSESPQATYFPHVSNKDNNIQITGLLRSNTAKHVVP